MSGAAWLLLAIMASLTGSALLMWFWGKKNGYIDESIKHRMLDEE